jgi:hypothetical protein
MSETREEKDTEFDAERDLLNQQQNQPAGAQPEQRPQTFVQEGGVPGEVFKRLKEAGSPLTNDQERMPREAFERAERNAEKNEDKAAPEAPFLPGTTAYIHNPDGEGSEHDGRAVAVNMQLRIDPKTGLPAEYECNSRDGRAERLYVKHEHLRSVPHTEFHRTQT